jgi:class 3 adenylate cyclase
MNFYEVADQVVKLLRQRGRLTYRSLKVQFELDDETLEALKDELLFSHPVVDEDGRGLVWTGDIQTGAFPPAQTTQPTTKPLPTEHRSSEAERRQLTMMFCDLVDSTKLSSQLDPEDYRDVVREYQKACSKVIERYDGHIAQYLGDGLLVYFGYTQSHEDEAQRAVHTGLGILNTLKQLNARLEQDKGIRLALRIGIHTGLVVVGDIGEGPTRSNLPLGKPRTLRRGYRGLLHLTP